MRKIGEIFLDKGIITSQQLELALNRQKITKQLLGQVLIDMNLVSEEIVTEVSASIMGVDIISLKDVVIHHKLLEFIPVTIVEKYKLLPLYIESNNGENVIYMVTSEEPAPGVIREISKRLNIPIRLLLATPTELNAAIFKYYKIGSNLDVEDEIIEDGIIEDGVVEDDFIEDNDNENRELKLVTEEVSNKLELEPKKEKRKKINFLEIVEDEEDNSIDKEISSQFSFTNKSKDSSIDEDDEIIDGGEISEITLFEENVEKIETEDKADDFDLDDFDLDITTKREKIKEISKKSSFDERMEKKLDEIENKSKKFNLEESGDADIEIELDIDSLEENKKPLPISQKKENKPNGLILPLKGSVKKFIDPADKTNPSKKNSFASEEEEIKQWLKKQEKSLEDTKYDFTNYLDNVEINSKFADKKMQTFSSDLINLLKDNNVDKNLVRKFSIFFRDLTPQNLLITTVIETLLITNTLPLEEFLKVLIKNVTK